MAWSWGDSFDLYAAVGDMANGYWDSVTSPGSMALVAGRFSGSRALQLSASSGLTKSSGVNDTVHHIVCSFQQTLALSGTAIGGGFQIFDGATAQCGVYFRSDGAIVLYAGNLTTTLLAIYTGAVTTNNTWYAFEFEIVINNTTGSLAVRKNGNNVNDFIATSLNTRVSANNYANKLLVGMNVTVGTQSIDDLFWQSGAATGSWLGDIRCYARMPVTDASVQFSPGGSLAPPFTPANGGTGANNPVYNGFVSKGGSLTSVTLILAAGYTGNMKCTIFACASVSALGTASSIGAILGTATAPINNPVTGGNTFNFSPAIALPIGTPFYVGMSSDTTILAASMQLNTTAPQNTRAVNSTTAYASFPIASVATNAVGFGTNNWLLTFTGAGNFNYVNEPQQDGLNTYVFDSNPGDQDFYNIGSIASTPATIIATTTRAYMQKSDAGTRTSAVQLKSGATTVASPTLTLSSSGWLWTWRTDLTDPNTGAAWTPAAVNNAQIGPVTIA